MYNHIHYSIKAGWRWLLYHLLPHTISPYSDAARASSGYVSSVFVPLFGCVAFIHADSGKVQYRW